MRHILALDIGYGYTKATAGGATVNFPSVIGLPEDIKYQGGVIGNGIAASTVQEISLELDGRQLFVGDLALKQSRITWSPQGRERVTSSAMITLALAAMSELEISGKINLVTGLPVDWYPDRDKLINQLKGSHELKRAGRETATIHIDNVIVVPQPFGTIYIRLLSNEAKMIDRGLLTERVGIIDVGMHTTDFVQADPPRLQYIEAGSNSIEDAMGSVYNQVIEAIKNEHQTTLSLHKADQVVQSGKIAVFGEKHSIAPILEPILQAVSQRITSAMPQTWGSNARDIDKLFITGGGASCIGPYLTDYPHLQIIEESALANVRGYLRYGLLKWQR